MSWTLAFLIYKIFICSDTAFFHSSWSRACIILRSITFFYKSFIIDRSSLSALIFSYIIRINSAYWFIIFFIPASAVRQAPLSFSWVALLVFYVGLRSTAVRVRLVTIGYNSGIRLINTPMATTSFIGAPLLFALISFMAF